MDPLDGGAMWSGVPDTLRQLPSRLYRWDREATSRLKEHQHPGSTVSDHIVEPGSGTQPQLHQGGCSGEPPREGLVPSRCGRINQHCRRMPVAEPWSGRHILPPIYRQLLSSHNPSDPYNNRELRDDNAETSVFWRRPVESGRKLKISPDVRWCQREFPSIWQPLWLWYLV